MTTPYDPTSGYQPSGGWGYHEWGQAGAEAWENAGQATANGDPTTASHWTELAQQADQQSHDVYVEGGPAYGSGGDTSGSDDGTYWGQGAVPATEAAPAYDTTPPYETAPSHESAPAEPAPSYETAPSYDSTPSYDSSSSETSGMQLDLHGLDHSALDHSALDLGL